MRPMQGAQDQENRGYVPYTRGFAVPNPQYIMFTCQLSRLSQSLLLSRAFANQHFPFPQAPQINCHKKLNVGGFFIAGFVTGDPGANFGAAPLKYETTGEIGHPHWEAIFQYILR